MIGDYVAVTDGSYAMLHTVLDKWQPATGGVTLRGVGAGQIHDPATRFWRVVVEAENLPTRTTEYGPKEQNNVLLTEVGNPETLLSIHKSQLEPADKKVVLLHVLMKGAM